MSQVWIVGSINMDTTYSVERLPGEGETIQALRSYSCLGGKGSNQAAAACWTGAKTYLVGMVGLDGSAAGARSELRACGIDLTYLETSPEVATGSAVICVDAQGANFIVVNGGANQTLTCKTLPFAPGDYVAAQLETPLETVRQYFTAAKERGAITLLNPSPYQTMPAELLAVTDILVANEHEAGNITGIAVDSRAGVDAAMSSLAPLGIRQAIVTLGKDGAALWDVYNGGRVDYIPGERVEVVDTQGAGDAFMGVLVGMLAQGTPILEAARSANHVAALCVCKPGSTIPSLPQKN